jgi:hypothetical protein
MRNAEYMPVAQLPVLDLGAQYEAAKARREEAELRKLEYLNQFQKTRGRIAEGVRPEVEKLWNQLQDNLASGDMSFEAKKQRQALYSQYKSLAADAVDYTQELDEREATILANPSQYRDPSTLLNELEKYRLRPVDAASLPAAISSLPSLSKFLRYQPKEMTPSAIAATISERLKAGGGIGSLYDPKTGLLLPKVAEQRVLDYFSANGLTAEQKEQAIINELRHRGSILTGGIEDISFVQNLSDKEQIDYINSFAKRTAKDLISNLSRDITTKAEERAAELSDYAAKVGIQGRQNERELNLAAALKQREMTPGVDPEAALRSYLQSNLGGDKMFMYEKTEGGKPVKYVTSITKEIANNLSPVLTNIGYKVSQNGKAIKITNPDGTKTETISVPEEVGSMKNAKSRQTVINEIISAVLNTVPAMDEDQVLGQSFYLNNLYNSGAIGDGQVVNDDPLGILIE